MIKINVLTFVLSVIISSNVCAEIYQDKNGQVIGSKK